MYKGDLKSNSSFNKVSKLRLTNIRISQSEFKKNVELIKEYGKERTELLDQETLVRNKIILSSATIKSESMFVDLDESLNSFRGKLNETLDFFYNAIEEDKVEKDTFMRDIGVFQEELTLLSNGAIATCKEKLDEELNLLKNGREDNPL
ncbi:hypothetical protein [Priestia megaterium]|uniref:hypothetical protein n=1 Tax=Priestia megaterium TaxID=1404 RepID=UPI002448D436|nr:hypothetical protein [Priestia megaterium]MDH2363778.1 hypothetical protein [Priestia megaterium]